ncbi:hypothetical protein [Stomatobaculum longum]|nr:hypothetical protein [Stomatobaculum longum]
MRGNTIHCKTEPKGGHCPRRREALRGIITGIFEERRKKHKIR